MFFATKGPVQKFDLNQGQTINFRLTKICYMGILYRITCSRNDNTVFGCSANAFFLPFCSHAYNINYNKFADRVSLKKHTGHALLYNFYIIFTIYL